MSNIMLLILTFFPRICLLLTNQDLERLEMVFNEGEKIGGGMMKPAAKGTKFGVLPEPGVVLHAMNSSE